MYAPYPTHFHTTLIWVVLRVRLQHASDPLSLASNLIPPPLPASPAGRVVTGERVIRVPKGSPSAANSNPSPHVAIPILAPTSCFACRSFCCHQQSIFTFARFLPTGEACSSRPPERVVTDGRDNRAPEGNPVPALSNTSPQVAVPIFDPKLRTSRRSFRCPQQSIAIPIGFRSAGGTCQAYGPNHTILTCWLAITLPAWCLRSPRLSVVFNIQVPTRVYGAPVYYRVSIRGDSQTPGRRHTAVTPPHHLFCVPC